MNCVDCAQLRFWMLYKQVNIMKSVKKYVVFHLKIINNVINYEQVNIMKTMKKCLSYFIIK